MGIEQLLALVSRLVHIGTAITLVGGTAVLRFVVIPALQGQPEELTRQVRNRWRLFVHIGIALFLISGFYNYLVVTRPLHSGDGLYHMLLGFKMLLAFGVFFLASVLVGRSPGTQKFRDEHTRWMTILLLVAAVVIGISSFVKVRGVPASVADSTQLEEPSGATD